MTVDVLWGLRFGRTRDGRSLRLVTLDINNAARYGWLVIASFADSESERLFRGQHSRRLPAEVQRRALRKLVVLNAATRLSDLSSPPGNRLEALKGERAGRHSIRINDQFRIVFRWDGGNAYEVEVVDYH